MFDWKTLDRDTLKMNVSAAIKERTQPKEYYAEEIQDGYSEIVAISQELKKLRDMASRECGSDQHFVTGIDAVGQLLAKFSQRYANVSVKLLKHV